MREITLYSPSPQPSPMKGEGVFLTFYEFVIIGIYIIVATKVHTRRERLRCAKFRLEPRLWSGGQV